jgi:hypothetical protein
VLIVVGLVLVAFALFAYFARERIARGQRMQWEGFFGHKPGRVNDRVLGFTPYWFMIVAAIGVAVIVYGYIAH